MTRQLISFGFITIVAYSLFSCNDSTVNNLDSTKSNEIYAYSDSIPFGDLIGKWTLEKPNNNIGFKTFIIDSSGFHNVTDSSIIHYKLLLQGNKFIISIYVTEKMNLITYYATDTIKIYWTSGQHETYIRETRSTVK